MDEPGPTLLFNYFEITRSQAVDFMGMENIQSAEKNILKKMKKTGKVLL